MISILMMKIVMTAILKIAMDLAFSKQNADGHFPIGV
jgi:hypothetical protein